jgi:transcriptional regulator with XRE-family HTH domain
LAVVSKPDIKARFGEQVRRLRYAKGVSQERLAQLAGLDRSYMGGVERGARNVSLVNVEKIAKAIGVPISELMDFG